MLDSRLVFHLLHKASHSFCISNTLCGEKALTFKRIFSQRYHMMTQLAAHFSILNTTTQLVAIKFFDNFLYGDITHRSHVETIKRMILWHKTTKHFNSEAQTVINHSLSLSLEVYWALQLSSMQSCHCLFLSSIQTSFLKSQLACTFLQSFCSTHLDGLILVIHEQYGEVVLA